MKKVILATFLILTVPSVVFFRNYLNVDSEVQKMLNSDVRNTCLDLNAHYEYYLIPSTLVLDLKKNTGSKADIFRSLCQSAAALKDKRFDTVILAHKGTAKFKLTGEYYNELGNEYELQKPMYLLSAFSENVLNIDGSKAYGTRYGGIFGALYSGLDDFNNFADKWYQDSKE